MNVLIVDDEPSSRNLLRLALSQPGTTVYSAEHGEEALTILEETGIDLIVSDIYMPVLDGLKLHQTIRAIPGYERVPFLFVSGFDDEYTLSAVKDPKIDGFYKKGRAVEELKQWVRYLLAPEDRKPDLPRGGGEKTKMERLGRTDRGGSKTPLL